MGALGDGKKNCGKRQLVLLLPLAQVLQMMSLLQNRQRRCFRDAWINWGSFRIDRPFRRTVRAIGAFGMTVFVNTSYGTRYSSSIVAANL